MHKQAETKMETQRNAHIQIYKHMCRSTYVETCRDLEEVCLVTDRPGAKHMQTKPFPHTHPNSASFKQIDPETQRVPQIH